MGLVQRIQEDLTQAMKAKEELRLSVRYQYVEARQVAATLAGEGDGVHC